MGSAVKLEEVDLRDTTSEVDGTELLITTYTGPHPSIQNKQKSLLCEYGTTAPSLRSFVFPDERYWTRSSSDSEWERMDHSEVPFLRSSQFLRPIMA
ncbi:hypothetical protein M407DRAFT_242444 [Tulasnella calospora MUT 4182]|uniref:Uncharacterized protein n=1 Tax=Tulasnella calospora MUT 4182 TaxID=1051891 RepID=A0A0C3L7Y3_9AGAM|nr:hypothetical protein M407DRAFT_242444 [Tulasnella calospora MUT 4182]